MATIRERRTRDGETRYEVQVRLAGTEPRVATFASLRKAQRWAQEQEVAIRERQRFGRVLSATTTTTDAIDRYLAERVSDLSPSGQRKRRTILGWWRDRIGHVPLKDLSPEHLSRALAALGRDGSGPGTQNRYLSAISRALEFAKREWRWIDHNPARDVSRRREPPGRVRYLSNAERERLLEACRASRDRELYPLVLIALATGARLGELVSLRWEAVDLDARRITFNATKNRERRSAAITGPAAEALDLLGPQESGPVFSHTVFRHSWERAVNEAGVEDFRFHDLRHTAASYLAMSGASLLDIAALLGHKTLAMVRRYAHLSDSHLSGVSDRMAEKFLTPKGQGDPSATR